MADQTSEYFFVLLRDVNAPTYKGLYAFDVVAGTAVRIHGQGPKAVQGDMVGEALKYDSGAKKFRLVHNRELTWAVDAFTLVGQHARTLTRPKF